MSILKIEAFSGLSGDMFLGALAELTGAYDELKLLPAKLNLDQVEVKISYVEKAGISCRHVKILDHNDYAEHKHVHNHGHSHVDATASKNKQFSLASNPVPDHGHHHNRHLKDIEKIIEEGDLTNNAKKIANEIFFLLGTAESKVHGVDLSIIHFHEVGAIDSILDIVGSAMLLDKLNIDSSVSTAICTGHGFVMADHGRMPIPAPATKELLLDVPCYAGIERGEMSTPTGAAILKYLKPSFKIPILVEKKTGHGPGEKDFPHPNVLRLSLCENSTENTEEIFMVETNIDDMSSELLGSDFQENLIEAGGTDFYYSQIMMKKGRPGILISVFASKGNVEAVTNFLLENTTTIGVRSYPASRMVLHREAKTIKTSLGEIEVKEVKLPSGKKRSTIEYESCKKIAAAVNKPIAEVYALLNAELHS